MSRKRGFPAQVQLVWEPVFGRFLPYCAEVPEVPTVPALDREVTCDLGGRGAGRGWEPGGLGTREPSTPAAKDRGLMGLPKRSVDERPTDCPDGAQRTAGKDPKTPSARWGVIGWKLADV